MADDTQTKRLKEPYRLVILKEDTLEEVSSYRLSLMNVYILVSAVLIITSAIVFSLMFFTPIRRLVPGYANVYESREYRELNNKVQTLEKEMDAQRLYIDRFRNLLSGIPTRDTSQPAFNDENPDDIQALARAELIAKPPLVQEKAVNVEPLSSQESPLSFIQVVPPVRGILSAQFNASEDHFGVDILAPDNTPLLALLDGSVIASDWTLETGNTLGIQHSGNMVSFYKHNARNLRKLGSKVNAGEAIAIIGNTGEATSGPHLHFEIWVDGQPVDPQRFINF